MFFIHAGGAHSNFRGGASPLLAPTASPPSASLSAPFGSGGHANTQPLKFAGRGSPVPSPPVNAPKTYFVRKTGLDANNGLTPSAAFLTIAHALSLVAAGDTVYVGAGTYREILTPPVSGNSQQWISLIADYTGAQTGDAGECIITAFTTNDTTAPSATALITLSVAFWRFVGFTLIAGTNSTVFSSAGTMHDIIFLACTLFSIHGNGSIAIDVIGGLSTTQLNLTVDSCIIFSGTYGVAVRLSQIPGGVDYDCGLLVRNCLFICLSNFPVVYAVNGTTGLSGLGGGGLIIGNTCIGNGVNHNSANTSAKIPTRVFNNVIYHTTNNGVKATTAGQIVEDNNVYSQSSYFAGVTTAGARSKAATYNMGIELGQALIRGAQARTLGVPIAGSPMLGLATATDRVGTNLIDLFGGQRPAGGGSRFSAVGALERANTFIRETSTVHVGTNAISILGPGYQDFALAVDAVATTPSIYLYYDSSYTGAPPGVQVLNGGQIAVGTLFVPHPGPASTWLQLTLPTFTPSAAGIVTIRVISYDTSGIAKVVADTFSVS